MEPGTRSFLSSAKASCGSCDVVLAKNGFGFKVYVIIVWIDSLSPFFDIFVVRTCCPCPSGLVSFSDSDSVNDASRLHRFCAAFDLERSWGLEFVVCASGPETDAACISYSLSDSVAEPRQKAISNSPIGLSMTYNFYH